MVPAYSALSGHVIFLQLHLAFVSIYYQDHSWTLNHHPVLKKVRGARTHHLVFQFFKFEFENLHHNIRKFDLKFVLEATRPAPIQHIRRRDDSRLGNHAKSRDKPNPQLPKLKIRQSCQKTRLQPDYNHREKENPWEFRRYPQRIIYWPSSPTLWYFAIP